jgi:hypothetical protein
MILLLTHIIYMQHYFSIQLNSVIDINLIDLQQPRCKSSKIIHKYKNQQIRPNNDKKRLLRELLKLCTYETDNNGIYLVIPVDKLDAKYNALNTIESIINYYDDLIDETNDYNDIVITYDYRITRYLFDKFTNFNYGEISEPILSHQFYDYYKINIFYLLVIINEHIYGKKLDYQQLHTIMNSTKLVLDDNSNRFSNHHNILNHVQKIILNITEDLLTYDDVDNCNIIFYDIIKKIILFYEKCFFETFTICATINKYNYSNDFITLFTVLILKYNVNYIVDRYVSLLLIFAIKTCNTDLIKIINDYCVTNVIVIDYEKYTKYILSVDVLIYLNDNGHINIIDNVEYYLSIVPVEKLYILFNYIFLNCIDINCDSFINLINTDNNYRELIITSIKKILSSTTARRITTSIDLYQKIWPDIFTTRCLEMCEYYRKLIRWIKIQGISTVVKPQYIEIKDKIAKSISDECECECYGKLSALIIYDKLDTEIYEIMRWSDNVESMINEIIPILLFELFDVATSCGFRSANEFDKNRKLCVQKCSQRILTYLSENYDDKYFNAMINLISMNVDNIIMSDVTIIFPNEQIIILPDSRFTTLLNPAILIFSTVNPAIISHLLNNYFLSSNALMSTSIVNYLLIYFMGRYRFNDIQTCDNNEVYKYIFYHLMKNFDYTVDEYYRVIDRNGCVILMSNYYNNIKLVDYVPPYVYSIISQRTLTNYYKTMICET